MSLPTGVQILAVSKLQPIEKIREIYNRGYRHFGENYPQELLRKSLELKDLDIKWHLIGHLQKNKVKMIVGLAELIHSVDSLALAKEINRRAQDIKIKQKILLQVNVAGEGSKEGFDEKSLFLNFSELLGLPHISICGLMTMPPFVENPEDNRIHFKNLKRILFELKKNYSLPENFCELSMGTSQDYKVAAEEGATWVRLGTTLFGPRQKGG